MRPSRPPQAAVLPVLEHYVKTPRESMQYINLTDMMTVNENAKRKD